MLALFSLLLFCYCNCMCVKAKVAEMIRIALSQTMAIMVKNLIMVSFGMSIGFRTVLIGGVLHDDEFQGAGESELSWLGSISMLTLLVGCIGSGFVTQPIGRKRSMQFVTIPYVSCWVGYYFSTKIWHLYIVLMVMGFFSGLVEGPFNTYVSEVTQPHLRGVLSISGSMSVMLGSFLQFLIGTFFKWRICALISCAFPLVTFFLFFLVPESPYWLISNNKLVEAKKSLAWLRGWTKVENIELEIGSIIRHYAEERDQQTRKQSSFKEYFTPFLKKSFIYPLLLVSFAFMISSFTGASTLQTYAIAIFGTMKLPINSYYATVCLGSVQLLGSLISIFLIRFLGKRRLFFIAISCMCICNMIIAIYAHFSGALQINLTKDSGVSTNLDVSDYKWVPLTFLILLSFMNNGGVHALPWILMSEVYSYKTRSVGCGLSSAVSSLLSFVANNLFLRVTSFISIPGMYTLHCAVCIVGFLVLYFYLPETEGKSLETIADHFAQKIKLDNKVQKKPLKKGIDNTLFEYNESNANVSHTVSKL
ncbi:facilitated trehalose transporter Tret1-like [Photinus pyralis]|uniref:facilitated trehalose transporter Tret1-like n=1 Tax=Photinus pyralis TaxID=7054 RepID=UPI0012672075|nr:facilitated trehalose transporter Tret1-like [Photinus pyralis]XP_031345771.1 facilitated trehalose transporter Tret1-like [Photinus pyralis]